MINKLHNTQPFCPHIVLFIDYKLMIASSSRCITNPLTNLYSSDEGYENTLFSRISGTADRYISSKHEHFTVLERQGRAYLSMFRCEI